MISVKEGKKFPILIRWTGEVLTFKVRKFKKSSKPRTRKSLMEQVGLGEAAVRTPETEAL